MPMGVKKKHEPRRGERGLNPKVGDNLKGIEKRS